MAFFRCNFLNNGEDTKLPYRGNSEIGFLTPEEVAFFENYINTHPSRFSNNSVDFENERYICFTELLTSRIVANRQWATVKAWVFYKVNSHSETLPSGITYNDFELYDPNEVISYTMNNQRWMVWQVASNYGDSGWYGSYASGGTNVNKSLFGDTTMSSGSDPYHSWTYNLNYPVYWSKPFYLNNDSSKPILL
ncbi:MAG: hypothetical protein J5725_00785 [Bacteroidales bacterium]|nr:hypothetical protein [Bacteroidales bacterium]